MTELVILIGVLFIVAAAIVVANHLEWHWFISPVGRFLKALGFHKLGDEARTVIKTRAISEDEVPAEIREALKRKSDKE